VSCSGSRQIVSCFSYGFSRGKKGPVNWTLGVHASQQNKCTGWPRDELLEARTLLATTALLLVEAELSDME
jgi:hypothetical protein